MVSHQIHKDSQKERKVLLPLRPFYDFDLLTFNKKTKISQAF